MMHIVILDKCGDNMSTVGIERMMQTYVNPPAYAETANKVSEKDGEETIYGPVMCDAHVSEVMYSEDELVPEHSEANGTDDEPAMLVRIGGRSSQEEVSSDFRAISSEIARPVEACVDDALVKFLVSSGMASLHFEGQSGGGRLKGSEGGTVCVLEKGIVFVDEKDFRGQARRGHDGVGFVVPNERALWGYFADPTGHDWGEEGIPCVGGGVDGTDGIFLDCTDGILGVVRVDFVGGVTTDKVEDCECAAGMCGEPSVWDAEEEVVVDDEGVTGEDAGGDVVAGPESHPMQYLNEVLGQAPTPPVTCVWAV